MVGNDIDPEQWARFKRDNERRERKKIERDAARQFRVAQWGDPASNLLPILKTRIPQYDWEKEGLNRASRKQKADILGIPSSTDAPKIFIEFELERATCVRNVIKAWMYVDNDGGEAFLIHVFSPSFQLPRLKHFLEEALFVGQQAQRATNGRIRYIPIPFSGWPKEHGTVLEQLAADICRILG